MSERNENVTGSLAKTPCDGDPVSRGYEVMPDEVMPDEVMSEAAAGEALRRMGIDPADARRRIKEALLGEKRRVLFAVKPEPVIAVLPFATAGAADDGPVLDLSDSINQRLSRLGGLVVRSAGSVQSLAGTTNNGLVLGRRLRATFVLSGDVWRDGERIRATARLIDVRDGSKVWHEECGGNVRRIHAVENHITEQMISRLNLRPSGQDLERLRRCHSENPDAYDKYRLARRHLNLYRRDSLDIAARLFGAAAALDPSFPLSHVGLSECHIARGVYNMASPGESFGRAEAHASDALALDPTLPEAHAAMGYVNLCYRWNWEAAADAFGRAVSLAPDYAFARQGRAHLLTALGDFDAAKAESDLAFRLDPVLPIVSTVRGFVYLYAGDLAESVRSFEAAKDVNDKFDAAYYGLKLAHEQRAAAYLRDGEPELAHEALAEAGRSARIARWCSERASDKVAGAAHHDALVNQRERARRDLTSLVKLSEREYVSPFHLAAVYLELGEPESALDYLEAGFGMKDQWLALLNVEPRFKSLRGHPRFEALIRRLDFPRR